MEVSETVASNLKKWKRNRRIPHAPIHEAAYNITVISTNPLVKGLLNLLHGKEFKSNTQGPE